MKKRGIAVSVVIPIYNSAPFLRKCLDSVACQTFKDFEVLMIDDGSTDSSEEIAREFAEKHENFKVFTQENKGVSCARNEGIRRARGEYLAFIDSDDFVSPDFLQSLYNLAVRSGAPIASCNYFHYYPGKNISKRKRFQLKSGVYSSEKFLAVLLKDVRAHYYLWNKLFKRSLFLENKIELPDMCFEDVLPTLQLVYCAGKVAIENKEYYYYTQRKTSLVRRVSTQKFNDYICAFAGIRNFLEKKEIYSKYKTSFVLYGARVLLTNFKLIFFLKMQRSTRESFLKALKTANNLVFYCLGRHFECFDDIMDFPKVFSTGADDTDSDL